MHANNIIPFKVNQWNHFHFISIQFPSHVSAQSRHIIILWYYGFHEVGWGRLRYQYPYFLHIRSYTEYAYNIRSLSFIPPCRDSREPEFLHSFSFADYLPCGVSTMLYHPQHRMLIVGSSPQQGLLPTYCQKQPAAVCRWAAKKYTHIPCRLQYLSNSFRASRHCSLYYYCYYYSRLNQFLLHSSASTSSSSSHSSLS